MATWQYLVCQGRFGVNQRRNFPQNPLIVHASTATTANVETTSFPAIASFRGVGANTINGKVSMTMNLGDGNSSRHSMGQSLVGVRRSSADGERAVTTKGGDHEARFTGSSGFEHPPEPCPSLSGSAEI